MKYLKLLFVTLLCNSFSFAQVGVNTTSIDASAALDIQYGSTPKGLLTPRMTTVQKLAIASPADGLIVYDTDLKSFYHYKTGSPGAWIRMSSEATGRLNFKRIKSTDVLATVLADELADGVTKYKLKSNTLYEINGAVTFDKSIDLNNAYVQGLDSGDDILISSGNIFDGATGGTVKGLTIRSTSGKVFNLSGANTENLIFRDCIVANSSSVGSINGFGLVFLSIVQFSGNTTGITYSNISQLLLSNLGWFGNNKGNFETLTGTFGLVQKQGGFSDLTLGTFGFDVSANPIITGDAVLESVVFTGDATGAKYVKAYTTGAYAGYNFNNNWTVRSTGIPTESDAVATGGFSMDYGVGTGIAVGTNNSNPSDIVKVINKAPGTTISLTSNLFRFGSDSPNSLKYLGKKKRIFQIAGSISVQVPNAATYIIYIAKGGIPISQYKIYGRGQVNGDIVVLPINGTVELSNNEVVEIYLQRFAGSVTDPIVPNLNVTIK